MFKFCQDFSKTGHIMYYFLQLSEKAKKWLNGQTILFLAYSFKKGQMATLVNFIESNLPSLFAFLSLLLANNVLCSLSMLLLPCRAKQKRAKHCTAVRFWFAALVLLFGISRTRDIAYFNRCCSYKGNVMRGILDLWLAQARYQHYWRG